MRNATPKRPANLVSFAYDWRLSNRHNGARLAPEIAPILHLWRITTNPEAKLAAQHRRAHLPFDR